MPLTNAKREIGLSLTLKSDESERLGAVRLEATEGLSRPFAVSLDVHATQDVDLLPNLGLPAAIECRFEGEPVRHYHGVLAEARFLDVVDEDLYLYRLTLVPAAHHHTFGSHYRIFQNKTYLDIIEEILGLCEIDFEIRIRDRGAPVAYCVQYGESDFDFVCRLMEEYGYYYFYRHTAGSHALVICDEKNDHETLTPARLSYMPSSRHMSVSDHEDWQVRDTAYLHAWHETASSNAIATTRMRDFNFKEPNGPVEVSADLDNRHEGPHVEDYRWQGRYFESGKGDPLARVALEAHHSGRVQYEAVSRFPGIQSGFKFTLVDHACGRFNREYLITSCRTVLSNETYRSGMDAGVSEVEIRCIRSDVQFRAPLVTPRPIARGPETAIVTGPKGEEIHIDEFGRIKVKFHWDRLPGQDDTSSCWIRVSQFGLLGSIVHPRVGQEVIVDFINGNPDRPIVVGRVYNAGPGIKYELPEDKTRAVWRTKTYKRAGGVAIADAQELDSGKPGANEIRFEDAPDKEEIYLHAERDMNARVRNCETRHVGKNEELKVGKDRTKSVGHDETITVEHDRKAEISNNDSLKVGNDLKIEAFNTIEIKAGQQIRLIVGSSSITIDQTSITIKALTLGLTGVTNAKLSGTTTEVSGSAMLDARGGIVKINC